MAHYRRTSRYRAVRLNPAGPTPVPDWLSGMLEEGRAYWQGGAEPYLTVNNPGGSIVRARLGERLVLGPDETVSAWSDEDFRREFEAEGLAPVERPTLVTLDLDGKMLLDLLLCVPVELTAGQNMPGDRPVRLSVVLDRGLSWQEVREAVRDALADPRSFHARLPGKRP